MIFHIIELSRYLNLWIWELAEEFRRIPSFLSVCPTGTNCCADADKNGNTTKQK